MLHCLFLGMAVGIQRGGEWGWVGLCESWYEKRCVRLVLEGEEGKVSQVSVPPSKGQKNKLVQKYVSFTLSSPVSSVGSPLCLWMSF